MVRGKCIALLSSFGLTADGTAFDAGGDGFYKG